jgi:hypothetical protein
MNAPLCVNCVYYKPGEHQRYPGEFSRCLYPRPGDSNPSFVTGGIVDRRSAANRWCEVERAPDNFRGTCTSKGRHYIGREGHELLPEPKPARRWWQWWRA